MLNCFRNTNDIRRAIDIIKIFSLSLLSSCGDFVDIPAPGTQLVQENVFKDDATAIAAMASVYIKLSDGLSFADGSLNSITLLEGLYSDELIAFSSSSSSPRDEFFNNSITPVNQIVASTWGDCYKIIYECNRILEGLKVSESVNLSLKNQLCGEALFVRAFCHFYLVNLFGDVPVITISDYKMNAKVSRTPSNGVYEQIIRDLRSARDLLSDIYPSVGRVRVNRGAAIAMLARAYLYTGDYINAETEATEIIDRTTQYKLLTNLDDVFLRTSEEAILQLLPGGGSQLYPNEGSVFILLAPPTSTNFALRRTLCDSFAPSDLRRIHWIDSITSSSGLSIWYFAHKYKEKSANATGKEYSMVLRLAEQYLIRAEARAKQNKLIGANSAEEDVNRIRNRAGLPNTSAASLEEFISAIEDERKFELFTEWGHRFFDLKRTDRLNAVLDPIKLHWDATDALFPLPQSELLRNSNLEPQNLGY